MKNIVILGASSFIASSLAEKLKSLDYTLTLVVRKEKRKKLKSIDLNKTQIIECDIIDYPTLFRQLSQNIDCLIPFTWEGTVSQERDNEQIQIHCLNLMQKCISNIINNLKCRCIITPGTVAEYGNNVEHKENISCEPDSMYGKCKLKFHEFVKSACVKNAITYYHIRIFSVYGESDYARKMLNTVICKLLDGEDYKMSSCTNKWNFLYIDDLIDLLMMMIENKIKPGCYNVGSDYDYTLREYISIVERVIQSKGKVIFCDDEISTNSLACNIDKLKSTTTWEPKTSFEDGIQKIVEKYRCNHN